VTSRTLDSPHVYAFGHELGLLAGSIPRAVRDYHCTRHALAVTYAGRTISPTLLYTRTRSPSLIPRALASGTLIQQEWRVAVLV